MKRINKVLLLFIPRRNNVKEKPPDDPEASKDISKFFLKCPFLINKNPRTYSKFNLVASPKSIYKSDYELISNNFKNIFEKTKKPAQNLSGLKAFITKYKLHGI